MNDIAVKKVFLFNEKVSLREFNKEDWMAVHQYASQDQVCQYQPWGPNSEEDSKGFIQEVLANAEQYPRTRHTLAIEFSGKLVGAGELAIDDISNRVGEMGYVVNPDYWGQGIATEAAQLLIKFGFQELELHRIFATCDPRNIGSAKVLEKVGMTKEGRLREHKLIRDGWRDSFLYSILEHEWKKSNE
ncbi:GNAT family N-acetyltransferase [Bacillus niameyensis]|uniref:GNAT family N-acetyltransferase n=1 Tax=Bacillus niameyensis TaxID=1522308 RepID=UPI000AFE0050|nr:GNAT family protein [Bacillus niameyensis]